MNLEVRLNDIERTNFKVQYFKGYRVELTDIEVNSIKYEVTLVMADVDDIVLEYDNTRSCRLDCKVLDAFLDSIWEDILSR